MIEDRYIFPATVQRAPSGAVIAIDSVPRFWAWRRQWAARNDFRYTWTQDEAYYALTCEDAAINARSAWLYE